MKQTVAVMAIGALAAGALVLACGGARVVPPECDHFVEPGPNDRTSVQTMFESAVDGDTLCFLPGTYRFEDGVSIADLDGITIQGTGADRDDVVLDFFAMGSGNSGLNAQTMTRLRIRNLRVIDAAQNDVFVTQSSDVIISNVSAGWVRRGMDRAGKYAIYPVLSQRVLIEDSEAFNAADAGIYVGQTQDCVVRSSVAFHNVAGIEIENSTRCEVYDNEAYENAAGILVFELPGIDARGGSTLVRDNVVRDNDFENFARDGIVRLVPEGIGIMVLAANQVEIRGNTISGNSSSGIVVVSYPTVIALGEDPPTDPDYDMFAEDIWLHANTCTNNGAAPRAPLSIIGPMAMPAVSRLEDIFYDLFVPPGSSGELCIDRGCTIRAAQPMEVSGVPGFPMQSTDPAPFSCEGMAVATVMPPSF